MQADQIQCQELKLNGLQCANPAYAYIEKDGKDTPLCRLHFSLYVEKHKLDISTFTFRTIDENFQNDAEKLCNFICTKPTESK